MVKLSDCPEYAALSYVWGPEDSSEIILDGKPFWIRRNLDFALRSVRATSWQMLFADAVCIGQGNLQEQSQQVQMMYQIYSQAKHVFICFGDNGPSTIEAVGMM